ncbi:MAG: DUF4179 domain-containing protein [Ktedonobacterales bacterium]
MPNSEPHGSSLHQRYADLLPVEQKDAALTRLVQDLDTVMNAPVPARQQQRISQAILLEAAARYDQHSELTPANVSSIRRQPRLSFHEKRSTMKQLWLRRPLVTAALIVVALLVLSGGTAFAIAQLDPGLAFQLSIPVASGPHYTSLDLSQTVGDSKVTLSRAAFTSKKVIIGYTYDIPVQSKQDGTVCALSLTSSEGDTFREFAGDNLPGENKNGMSHGSVVMYFTVDHLQGNQQTRHLHLLMHLCDSSQPADPVAFDFTVPLQK